MVRFICKATHNHFIKGKEYTGIELSDGIDTIQFITKDTFGFDTKWQPTKQERRDIRLERLIVWRRESLGTLTHKKEEISN